MRILLRPEAQFDLAQRLRQGAATLGEAFEFTSGLYFRGKLLYARTFARTPEGVPGVLVIAPGAGLVAAEAPVDVAQIRRLGNVPVDAADRRFRQPLEDAARLVLRALRLLLSLLGPLLLSTLLLLLGLLVRCCGCVCSARCCC